MRDISGRLQFNAVEVPSVNTTVRVLAHNPIQIPTLRSKLEELGSFVEVNADLGMLAVSIPPGSSGTNSIFSGRRTGGRTHRF